MGQARQALLQLDIVIQQLLKVYIQIFSTSHPAIGVIGARGAGGGMTAAAGADIDAWANVVGVIRDDMSGIDSGTYVSMETQLVSEAYGIS